MSEILEKLASLEHEQWCNWSRSIAKEIESLIEICKENSCENDTTKRLEEKLDNWSKLWIPYDELSEEMKDLDREYALKVISELESADLINKE